MVVVAIFIAWPTASSTRTTWRRADLGALTRAPTSTWAGSIMWIPGGLVFLIALSVVFSAAGAGVTTSRWPPRRRARGG